MVYKGVDNMSGLVYEWDDFGANHITNDMIQSRDCRKELDELHYINPAFKATLFTIPGEMTAELTKWCKANESWIQLAIHGFYHTSNYECHQMTYDEFDEQIKFFEPLLEHVFVKGFRAPGWQISDDVFRWLKDHDWWVADQSYNDDRRPPELKAYVNDNGTFKVDNQVIDAWHGHVWNCMGNGIEETFNHVKGLVESATEFKFVSEILL